MVLTKEHLMAYYAMTEEQVEAEIKRLKEAKRHEVLFTEHKPTDQDRIETLVSLASIPAYGSLGMDHVLRTIKGPIDPDRITKYS
jgi:hypothetical protein